jgi:uncharacterized protein involved in copper resistance
MMRALVLLMIAGCAAPQQRAPAASQPEEDIAQLSRAIEQAERELEGPTMMTQQADCGHVCELEHRICELAERICAIAERHPDDADAKDRCNDGRLRCERAHARVRAQCTCLDRPGGPARSY